MTTTISPVEFSDPDDGWSEPPVPELELAAAADPDQGDPQDDPAGAGTVVAVDPEAPWGRFKNGKPKKKPRGSAAPARRMPPAPRKTGGRKAAPARAAGPDYTLMSVSLIREITATGGVIAGVMRSPALMADVVMVDLQTDTMAAISADFAEQEPRWARQLQRITSVSKWTGPISVGLGLVAQAAVNHGMLPPGIMGTRPPEELLDIAEQRAKRAQELADQAAIRDAA